MRNYHVEFACKERRSAVLALPFVRRMRLEEIAFMVECRRNGLRLVNIPLTAVNNWDIAQTEGDDSAGENVDDVGALVPA